MGSRIQGRKTVDLMNTKKITIIRIILAIVNALAVAAFMVSVSFLYSNQNFKVGITNLNTEVYEDSPSFMGQFTQDVQYAFDYIETQDVFETDGVFDASKPIFSISDGPAGDTEYTIQNVITTARRRGYYLDENYKILSVPDIVTSNDESSYTVNWTTYQVERPMEEPSDQYVTIDQLITEVLTLLEKYYAAYDNLVLHPTNFSYRIEYGNKVFTNNNVLSSDNVTQFGRYAICESDTLKIENNLPNAPTNMGILLESSRFISEDESAKALMTVDTNYPRDDVYKNQSNQYAMEREDYFRELLVATIAVITILITLIALIVIEISVYKKENTEILSKASKASFEGRIFACALAIIVLLYLNEKVFKRVMHIYMPYDSWEFAERVTGYACIYGCVMITAFSILRSALAGNLWECSLIRSLFEKLDKYIEEHSFSNRATIVFISIITLETAVVAIVTTMIIKEHTLVARFVAIAIILLYIIGNMLLLFMYYKKTQQQDKISEAIGAISKGRTSYQLNEEEFDGKEKTLAHRLNNISSGLDKAINEKVKSERMKADLITNVSHDIKTPLTSIINYVDLIKREKPTDPKICEYLEVLDQKSQHLKHLTEDLVEASRASSGNVNLQMTELDFVEMVMQANGEFEEKFAERGLSIVSSFPKDENGEPEPLMIKADGATLWRVLENVYNNAYKYAMENSRVYVDMCRDEEGKAKFVIKNVSANPLNISADELTERFVRGDVSRTTEGSGLGLSIAGSLTRLQGGSFQIQIDGDLFKAVIRI